MSEHDAGLAGLGLADREQERHHEVLDSLQWVGRRLEAEEESRRGGVVPFADHEHGIFMIVESNTPAQAHVANTLSAAVSGFLIDSDEQDPTTKSRQAMEYANSILAMQPRSTTGRRGDREQVAISLMHIAENEDGTSTVHTASIGGGKVVKYPASDKSRKNPVDLSDNADRNVRLDGSDEALASVEYSSTEIDGHDRFAIASSEVVSNYVDKGLTAKRHQKVAEAVSRDDAANALLGTKESYRDKDVIVIDVDLPESVSASVAPQAAAESADPQQQEGRKQNKVAAWFGRQKAKLGERWAKIRGRDKKVGTAALAGAGVNEPDNGGRRGKHRAENAGDNTVTVQEILARNPEVAAARPQYAKVTHNASRRNKHPMYTRPGEWYADGQTAIADSRLKRRNAYYEKQRGHKRYDNEEWTDVKKEEDIDRRWNRRKVGLGLALVAGLTGYRFSADPGHDGTGQGWASYGEHNDKGWDPVSIPFANGDAGQGDGFGYDYNASNRSPVLNDDPTIAHWDKHGALDLAPAWMDGDPMDWNWDGTDEVLVWDPGDTNLPDPREHGAGNGGSRVVDTPAPRGTGPGWDSPAMQPEMVNMDAEAGTGLRRELHQFAHGQMGIASDHFDDEKAGWVDAEMRRLKGDDYITLLDYDGHDVYDRGNGDIGISAPGRMQWADIETQNLVESLIRRAAATPNGTPIK